MPDQFKTHSLMRLQAYGGMVVLQPYEEGGVVGRALTIDLQTGKLALGDAVDQIKVGFTTVYGIMGMVRLHTGCILIVATGAEQVIQVMQCRVSHICMPSTFACASGKVCCSTQSGRRKLIHENVGSNFERLSCLQSHRHSDLRQVAPQ